MAKRKRPAPRPAPAAANGGPRRLGGTSNPRQPTSQSAQRRLERRRRARNRRYGWGAVVVVIVVVLAIVLTNVLGSSSPKTADLVLSGRDPSPAPASLVHALETVPASAFNSVGTTGQPLAFTLAKGLPRLGSATKPQFFYYGAEFCPYCAIMRWSVITALGRFGSFKGLKLMTSDSSDTIADVPTFSFYKSTYTSPYLTFTPYEYEDREGQAFQTVPPALTKLYLKFCEPPFVPATQGCGIPMLDIANKWTSDGVTVEQEDVAEAVQHGGPGGRPAIAQAIRAPSSSTAKAIGAGTIVAQANYIAAAICDTDNMRPSSVCDSHGVTVARKALLAQKPIN